MKGEFLKCFDEKGLFFPTVSLGNTDSDDNYLSGYNNRIAEWSDSKCKAYEYFFH